MAPVTWANRITGDEIEDYWELVGEKPLNITRIMREEPCDDFNATNTFTVGPVGLARKLMAGSSDDGRWGRCWWCSVKASPRSAFTYRVS